MRALTFALALTACTPAIEPGFFTCGEGGRCPPRQFCHSTGICQDFPEGGGGTFASPCSSAADCTGEPGLICDRGPGSAWTMGYCTLPCTVPEMCPFPACYPWGACLIPCTSGFSPCTDPSMCIGMFAGPDREGGGVIVAGACLPDPNDAPRAEYADCIFDPMVCQPGSACLSDGAGMMAMCARPCTQDGLVNCAPGEQCVYTGDFFALASMCALPCTPGGTECDGQPFASVCTDPFGDGSTFICLPANWQTGGVVMPS